MAVSYLWAMVAPQISALASLHQSDRDLATGSLIVHGMISAECW